MSPTRDTAQTLGKRSIGTHAHGVAKVGRPSSYTKAIGEAICERIGCGQSLTTICPLEGMPDMTTVWRWLRDFPEFHTMYVAARDAQADALAERILDISDSEPLIDEMGKVDSGMVAHQKMRMDALKWRAARLKPKVYGDKVTQEITGAGGGAIFIHTGVPEPKPQGK